MLKLEVLKIESIRNEFHDPLLSTVEFELKVNLTNRCVN